MTKVLLVEDNEMNRDMLSRRLSRRGYIVLEAVDGTSGIDAARQEDPDVILMDISLPGIDGWEATSTLKSLPETSNIPIIVLTAHATPQDKAKSKEAGCDEFETKPVELNRLIMKIEFVLRQRTES